ncbi:FAD protein [Venustampulla echinocandica]|uniref:FAD protein n=1 Tax=Venustampulla echinocandica TaxID=2656787 RepID=A0A370T8U2_9HELO|nr:FAD protein [Venustampulla echinocandica]RDL29905.1 FAD protein [Venustampulla echinocandica]
MHVIVAGTGPSGLALALILAKRDIKVSLLDAAAKLDDRPRAAHYAPPAIRVLREAGVLEDVRKAGFIPGNFTWRKLDGSLIAAIRDTPESRGEDGLTVLPLDRLGKVLLSHAEKNSNITIKWNHKVVDIGQDETSAWAVVRLQDGTELTVKGDYVCGCDGANSQVRKSLFGETFPGKTWDAQVIATNVYYPLEKFGFDDINNIIHPTDYYMAAKITNEGLWRVSYGEDPSLTPEQVIANQPAKYERMLPGNPKPGDYKLLNVGPYRIHQRCADKMRVGRILLAADAAHLCNPFGGMGLTGGLVDVGGLAQCLGGINEGLADDSILEKYCTERRRKWKEVIDVVSSSNFTRVSATDPERAQDDDEFIAMVVKMETDEELRKQWDDSLYDIVHDFTQYYRTAPGNNNPKL